MERLVREYEKIGFLVKIFAPNATDSEKTVKRAEIREKVLRSINEKEPGPD